MEIKTVSFKEVQAELERESLFLHKNHNVRDFSNKSNFLSGIGFTNSIATELYSSIVNNQDTIRHYTQKYPFHKFILTPQLKRVCEKYDLYVRDLNFFLGDIPEKNIQDMMSFYVYLDDLQIPEGHRKNILDTLKTSEILHTWGSEIKIPLSMFSKCGLTHFLEIASVKELLSDKAFRQSTSRIISEDELSAKHSVDLDPIVMCKVRGGRIIITAWGDEANDELVLKETLN